MKRLSAGHYLLGSGFGVVRDDHSFSQVMWVIYHEDHDIQQQYIKEGYDYCFFTLREAKEYMTGLTVDNMAHH